MSPSSRLKEVALAAILLSHGTSVVADSSSCETICKHVQDPGFAGSIGSSLETNIHEGNTNILVGKRDPVCAGYYEASGVWQLYVKALESHTSFSVSNIQESGSQEDRVCVDKATLAKLTAAASQCHSQGGGGGGSSTGSMRFPPGDQDILGGATGGSNDGGIIGGATGGGGSGGGASGGADGSSFGTGGGSSSSGSAGGGSNIHVDNSGGSSSSSSSGGGSVSHSSSGWGHGNVKDQSICFKMKDKRSDRYLTSGGSEYAFAYYPNYYSIFKAYPSKSAEGGYTVTEVNRSGGKVNYPVKISDAYSSFKPLYGDKDAIWTFSPAQFGDSCWGTPNKKMSRRHDWGGWGDNYRFSSSGEDCADVELEEADC